MSLFCVFCASRCQVVASSLSTPEELDRKIAAVFAGVLRLPRNTYLAIYIPVTFAFFVWFVLAEDIGLPVVVSSALETSVGIAAGVALAAALPELDFACGLNTVALLQADVVTESLLATNGVLPVIRPNVDEAALGAAAAADDRRLHWEARAAQVREIRQDQDS